MKVLGNTRGSHVGSAEEGENSNLRARERLLKEKGPLWAVAGQIRKVAEVGLNLNSPRAFKVPETYKKAQWEDIAVETEIQANIAKSNLPNCHDKLQDT